MDCITHTKLLLGQGKALLRKRVLEVGNFLVATVEESLRCVGIQMVLVGRRLGYWGRRFCVGLTLRQKRNIIMS